MEPGTSPSKEELLALLWKKGNALIGRGNEQNKQKSITER
jgi:hypothetical protein